MPAKYSKTIICLANSRKISGRCVAGKEVTADGKIKQWTRPVSARPAGELSEEERRFEDGQDPVLLDVVKIPMIEPRPQGAQTENHVIDDSEYWVKERRSSWSELRSALDTVTGHLWDNSSSGSNGQYDRVAVSKAMKLPDSLKLIEVKDLKIEVVIEGEQFKKRKTRGKFSVNGVNYKLAITDPKIEREYLAKGVGEFNIGSAILCISLGDVFKGYAYKLVASVFLPPANEG